MIQNYLINYTIIKNQENFINNKLKQDSKGFETIIENDIPSLNDNNYEIVIKKAKNQKNKIRKLLDDVDNKNINEKMTDKYNSPSKKIEKLHRVIKLYKENFISVYNLLTKAFNKIIELSQINKKIKESILEFSLMRKKEEAKEKNDENNIKNIILEIHIKNLDKLKIIYY